MNKKKSGMGLFWGGLLLTIVLLLWPILMFISEVQGTVGEQLEQIAQDPSLYMANFFIASLIAPALIILLVTLAFSLDTNLRTPLLDQVGIIFLVIYAVLVSIAYTSQYVYLPGLLTEGEMSLAKPWFFHDGGTSISYFLNQLGYACFGAAALLIGYKLLFERAMAKAAGVLLWASGLLSLAAFAGLALQIEIQGVISIISGLLMLPVSILAIFWGKKLLQEVAAEKYFL